MKEKETQKVLDDLQAVRPELLDEKGKRLFDAIMQIVDERDQLKKQVKIKNEYLDLIISIGFDYDGYDNDNAGLKEVIDQLVDYAKKAIDNDDKTAIYEGSKGMKNILLENIDNHIPHID